MKTLLGYLLIIAGLLLGIVGFYFDVTTSKYPGNYKGLGAMIAFLIIACYWLIKKGLLMTKK